MSRLPRHADRELRRSDIVDTQNEKLRALLHKVGTGNAFYREKYRVLDGWRETTVDRIDRLSLTTKAELVEDQERNPPYGTNLTFSEDRYLRLHSTSGTTGKPLHWLDTHESWRWLRECWREILEDAGVVAQDRVFVAFSFGPFIGFWAGFEAAQDLGALTLTGGALTTEERLANLIENRATVLVSTPTYALRMAEVARERGIDLAESDIRLTIHAGEPGASLPNTKARIEESWGARCVDHAGATEVGAWGVTESGSLRMRILEEHFIAEVLDPRNQETVTPDHRGRRVGELVLTNLGRHGSPVIRYRTGDLVELLAPSAETGIWSTLEGGVRGRTDGMIVVRGVNVYPSAIENLVRGFAEIDEFRVTVHHHREMAELDLEIEAPHGGPDLEERLGTTLHEALKLRPRVRLAPPASLPRYELKARRFRTID